MFVKITFDPTAAADGTNHQLFMQDLSAILKGTLTDPANATSPFINKSNSTITGSLNTSLYSVNDATWHDMYITKYHHGKTIGYDPSSRTRFYWSSGGRPSARTLRADGSGGFPDNTANGSDWGWSGHPAGTSPGTYPTQYDKMFIAASDYWFIIQLVYQQQVLTYMLMDYEATATDTYQFQTLDSLISPQLTFTEHLTNVVQDDNVTNDYPILGRSTYMQKNGLINNGQSTINADHTIGFTQPNANTAFQFFPQMRQTIAPQPLFGGDGHLLQPVYIHCTGDARDVPAAPAAMGKVPYFYRTTDNITNTGDIVTLGADQYVSLAFHKCGGNDIVDVDTYEVAHYLVPVTIGGV